MPLEVYGLLVARLGLMEALTAICEWLAVCHVSLFAVLARPLTPSRRSSRSNPRSRSSDGVLRLSGWVRWSGVGGYVGLGGQREAGGMRNRRGAPRVRVTIVWGLGCHSIRRTLIVPILFSVKLAMDCPRFPFSLVHKFSEDVMLWTRLCIKPIE